MCGFATALGGRVGQGLTGGTNKQGVAILEEDLNGSDPDTVGVHYAAPRLLFESSEGGLSVGKCVKRSLATSLHLLVRDTDEAVVATSVELIHCSASLLQQTPRARLQDVGVASAAWKPCGRNTVSWRATPLDPF
ncbi:hypothetical protein ON010_g10743 [Phytophthora cinnamomi]|nr:hypothetical protein ON010_g10743 [Phytophthora cinnamomi]